MGVPKPPPWATGVVQPPPSQMEVVSATPKNGIGGGWATPDLYIYINH
jgi:hypothetical protein